MLILIVFKGPLWQPRRCTELTRRPSTAAQLNGPVWLCCPLFQIASLFTLPFISIAGLRTPLPVAAGLAMTLPLRRLCWPNNDNAQCPCLTISGLCAPPLQPAIFKRCTADIFPLCGFVTVGFPADNDEPSKNAHTSLLRPVLTVKVDHRLCPFDVLCCRRLFPAVFQPKRWVSVRFRYAKPRNLLS